MAPIDNTKYAFALARAVDLLRQSAEPGEPQKAALRSLVNAAAERSANIRFYDSVLTIDGEVIATSDPRLVPFTQRLTAQNVAEVVIAKGADPGELLALATGLAQEAGRGRIKERLRDAASSRVMVVIHQAPDASHRPPSVTGAFAKVKMDEAVMTEWNKFLNHGAQQEQLDRKVDLGFQAAPGKPAAPPPPPAPATPARPSVDLNAPQGEKQIRFDSAPTGSRPATGQGPAAGTPGATPTGAAPLPQPTTVNAASPLGTGLAKLLSNPYGAETLVQLTVLSRHLEDAFKHDRVAEALDVCNTLVEVEAKAPESARNAYGVIMKRMLNRASLAQIAPYLLESRRKNRAVAVLRRGGEDTIGLLVGLLGSAQTLGERMIYLEVLRGIPAGGDRVLALLSRSEWQVVRNTAEVAGEARMEEAVPYLARLTEHADDRVRRTAIVALAHIGTGPTVEPLRNILKAAAPELRAQVANAIGGAHSRALVTPLVTLAESEDNADVIRAYYKAIGRIGTAEAKNALEKAAAVRTLFSRRAKVAADAAGEVLKTMGA